MDKFMKAQLRENEKVLWEGRPQNIKFFEAPHTGSILMRWLICILGFVFIAWYNISIAPANNITADRAVILSTILGLAFLYTAITPILDVRRLKNKVHYYVTNERVIAYKEGYASYRFQSRDFNVFDEVTVDILSNGTANLFIGPMTKELYRHSRANVPGELKLGEENCPIVFANLVDAFQACSHLPKEIKVNEKQFKSAPSFAY